jgi:hypothetical protein
VPRWVIRFLIYQGPHVLAPQRTQDIPRLVQVEHQHGDALVPAKGGAGGVHDVQAFLEDDIMGENVIFFRAGIYARVAVVDAVDIGGLEHHLGLNFSRAQGRRAVCCEEGVARAAAENDHLPRRHGLKGLPLIDAPGHLRHHAGRLHQRGLAQLLEGVLQRQGVHHGGQHAHLIRAPAVHGPAGAPAPEIPAAGDDAQLGPGAHALLYMGADAPGQGEINAVARRARQEFAAELENRAGVL